VWCKRLEAAAFTVPEIQAYINENYVPVWVDDKRDARFAGSVLGLPDKGYPNAAVYAPGGEYLDRIVGFIGNPRPDEWFGRVKTAVETGKALADARKAAQSDPARWRDVAAALSEIEGREEDALNAMDKVPAEAKDEAYATALKLCRARAKWVDVKKGIDDAVAANRQSEGTAEEKREALNGIYAGAITEVDDFLRDHKGGCARSDARALAQKARFLYQLDRKKEARAVAAILLNEYPDSQETDNLLRGIR
jgi:hypothetical protein